MATVLTTAGRGPAALLVTKSAETALRGWLSAHPRDRLRVPFLGQPPSAGALAVTRALQQGQVARNNSMRGLIGGMSI